MEAPLTIRLFGPMNVLIGDKPLPKMRSRKGLWLLALLSTRANRPVAREWLASTLWPDVDLATAFANQRPVLSELRRALGEYGERICLFDRNTVVFDAQDVAIDMTCFDAAIRQADFERAVDIYQGALLEGCNEEWATQERSARELDCLHALLTLGEQAFDTKDYDRALLFFGRAAGLDPWRDAPRRGLMKTFAAKRDVNAALYTYRGFAHALRSKASMEPDAATTELYRRLRADANQTLVPKSSDQGADVTADRLPCPLTELVGRENQILDLAATLRTSRLVTMVGPGGIGKTRLAVEVARRTAGEYPDGAWFVSLEGLDDEHQVAKEVAQTLEISDEPGHSTLKTLARALRNRQLLLVLDNCEHVLSAVADLAATLLRGAKGLRIVATSREPIRLAGERVCHVPSLTIPPSPGEPATLLNYESVRLFVQRAQAVNHDFEITSENATVIASICARLEGVPLALELAATRLSALTLTQVAERIENDALRLLCGGNGTLTKRHQTLRATLDWSYERLSMESKALLRCLAIFADGWTLEEAEDAIGEGVAESLAVLVDKSLVVFDERKQRYRFLETIRQYASERAEGHF